MTLPEHPKLFLVDRRTMRASEVRQAAWEAQMARWEAEDEAEAWDRAMQGAIERRALRYARATRTHLRLAK